MVLDWSVASNAAMFAVIILAAMIYLGSKTRRDNQDETKELADTRGLKIQDQDKKIQDMENRITKQDGKIELLLSKQFGDLVKELRIEVHRLKEIK